jgi:hypothetical protein
VGDFNLDPEAIREWARESPELRNRLSDISDEIADLARVTAPVSPRGSKYSPPGSFKATGFLSTVRDDSDGIPYGLSKEKAYPGAFLGNSSRRTRNANRIRGVVKHYGWRSATRLFLHEAVTSVSSLYATSDL